jgi:anti-anti-sigma regulatory factor
VALLAEEGDMGDAPEAGGFSLRTGEEGSEPGPALVCPEDMTVIAPDVLRGWCEKLLACRGATLAVDLRATRYIQSHHLGVFADGWAEAIRAGRRMVLLIPPRLRRVFETSGFDRVFELVEEDPR